MRSTPRRVRPLLSVTAILLTALLIAGCGGSSSAAKTSTHTGTTSVSKGTASAKAARAAFRSCLRQHGVPLPSHHARGLRAHHRAGSSGAPASGTTPAGGAGGGAGIRALVKAKFAKVFEACRSKLGRSGRGFGRHLGVGARRFGRHFSTAALDAYVSCVRRSGYPAMPEPNTSGKGSVFPASVRKSAAFRAASAKCVSILRRALLPSAAGSTTATTSSA